MKKYDITISTILMVVAAGLFTASSGLPEVEGAIGAGTWRTVVVVELEDVVQTQRHHIVDASFEIGRAHV